MLGSVAAHAPIEGRLGESGVRALERRTLVYRAFFLPAGLMDEIAIMIWARWKDGKIGQDRTALLRNSKYNLEGCYPS